MKKLILVPLKRNDRAEDLLPYVEEVARPGMNAVFMVPYPVDGFRWSTEEFGRKAIEEENAGSLLHLGHQPAKSQRPNLVGPLKVLPAKGIEVAVDLYAGSVRSAVREYATKGDIHLIVTRAGIGQRIAGFLNGSSSLFDLFKRPTVSTVLLIHPGMAA